MSSVTRIEWTEVTWNPTTGCDRISPGCDHCYALTLAKRLKAMGQAKYQCDGDPRTSGPGFALTVHEDALFEPLRWRRPRKVFVNSMSDIGHARVPTAFVARVFATMAMGPQHQFQVLTKRPRLLRRLLESQKFVDVVWAEMERLSSDDTVPLARSGHVPSGLPRCAEDRAASSSCPAARRRAGDLAPRARGLRGRHSAQLEHAPDAGVVGGPQA
ncbi:DUF5131 family protein [Streptomyces sp. 2A115]|uniref:DUF5131 family protein n=1 Tax=Streptomyces sp. 2A115 TaxID=3457439 RepID=UPI003FD4947F